MRKPVLAALALALSLAAAGLVGSDGRSGGIYPVVLNGKWGYIDRSGKLTASPQFEDAWPFSEGMAAVKMGGADMWIAAAIF